MKLLSKMTTEENRLFSYKKVGKKIRAIFSRRGFFELLSKIPERQYWPIFIILSLYFVVPMSEITVTLAALLYFKFESRIRPVIGKLTTKLPDWLRYGGSVIFFLVMIDDTLFYFALIALAFYCSKEVRKLNKEEQTK